MNEHTTRHPKDHTGHAPTNQAQADHAGHQQHAQDVGDEHHAHYTGHDEHAGHGDHSVGWVAFLGQGRFSSLF